ncbi:MAG: PmoA family protein [Planctomycetaceae bacterium]
MFTLIGRSLVTALLFLGATSQAADSFTVTITPSAPEMHSLVEIPLPEGVDPNARWEVVDSAGERLPSQPGLGEPRRVIVKSTRTEAAKYTLRPSIASGREKSLQVSEIDGQLRLLAPPHELLTYHTRLSQPPAGIAAHYSRSGHIHPLMVPGDRTITAEYPVDHPHQNGVFFAWVNTTFDNHEVDFWNLGKQLGSVRHKRLVESVSGELFAGFAVELEHVDRTHGETVVLDESWRVMAFPLKEGDREFYLVDLESKQTAASDKPLTVNEYHYGGFGWRGSIEWLSDPKNTEKVGCTFLTSEGLDRVKGNHTRPDWVAVSGLIGGEVCSIAIFGHPSNFRHPQPVRLHPSKPYFCFAPCVIGGFEISREKPLTSKYRIVTHTGPPNPELYHRLVKTWARPPKVVVE